jgi:L-amino acid N-acyltransferase YncA
MPNSPDTIAIRAATDADRDAVWEIFHATVAPADAFVYDPNTPREEAEAYWFAKGTRTYVAEQDGK